VVTTPQDAASNVAERAGRMAQHPNVKLKLLGVIENMTGFVCPHCGETTDVFGTGGGQKTAHALGVPSLGAVPMQVSLREGADTGRPVVLTEPDSPAGLALREIASNLAKASRTRVGKSLPLTVAPG
jgi:ATP-binding protein involved in chromosome partitioning